MGLNKFSTLTDEEFIASYLAPKPYSPEWENVDVEFKKLGVDIDWVAKGKVSPIKDVVLVGHSVLLLHLNHFLY
jgi:hypothetical protein